MPPITALCHLVESTEIICALPVTHTQILGYVVTSSKIVDEAHGFQSKTHTPIQVWFGDIGKCNFAKTCEFESDCPTVPKYRQNET